MLRVLASRSRKTKKMCEVVAEVFPIVFCHALEKTSVSIGTCNSNYSHAAKWDSLTRTHSVRAGTKDGAKANS